LRDNGFEYAICNTLVVKVEILPYSMKTARPAAATRPAGAMVFCGAFQSMSVASNELWFPF